MVLQVVLGHPLRHLPHSGAKSSAARRCDIPRTTSSDTYILQTTSPLCDFELSKKIAHVSCSGVTILISSVQFSRRCNSSLYADGCPESAGMLLRCRNSCPCGLARCVPRRFPHRICGLAANQAAQVIALARKQAQVELAFGGQTGAVAVAAKMLVSRC